jgi:hypothetical protein
MVEIARLPTERARCEPEAVFERPEDIIEELLLTRGQKLAALARWREQVLERRRVAARGLLLPDLDELNADNELLASIDRAETALAARVPDSA